MRQDQADLDRGDDEGSDDLQRRLHAMATWVAEIPSVSMEVHRQVAAAAAPRPRRWPIVLGMASIVMAACAVCGVLLMPASAPRPHGPAVAIAAAQGPQLQLGEAVIEQRLAAFIDSRAVLVCWSCRDARPAAPRHLTGPLSMVPRGNYVELPLRRESLRGKTFCWSIFIAREEGAERDSPPMLLVDADGEQIAFGASPKHYPPRELARVVASANFGSGAALRVDEIQRLAAEYEKPGGPRPQ